MEDSHRYAHLVGEHVRVVLIHRYFWPDTPPYAHILRQIAERLGEAGHDVEVLTCQPSYNRAVVDRAPKHERLTQRVLVRRWSVLPDRRLVAVKVVNLIAFCFRLLTVGRTLGQVDVVMAASSPPIAVAKVSSWLAAMKGARFVYHKQDIYPEVMTAPGIVQESRRTAALRWLDARTERAADRVVVLSEDMAKTILGRGTNADRVEVINNFDPWIESRACATAGKSVQYARDGREQLQVVFAGSLGRFQNLEVVIAAAVEVADDERVAFHFFGDGALRQQLEREVEARDLRNVYVHGYQPPGRVGEFLRSRASLGIVSLAPGVIRAAYPSKTMSYLRHGCPVLALVESDSDLARTITVSGAGIQANPSNAADVARALRRLADNPTELIEAGRRAESLYHRGFGPERQLRKWIGLFEELVREAR